MDLNSNADPAPKRAIRHSYSADQHMKSVDWHKLEIRTRSNLYLIIQLIFRTILTFINRGCLSKFKGTVLTLSSPLFKGFSLLIFQFPLC